MEQIQSDIKNTEQKIRMLADAMAPVSKEYETAQNKYHLARKELNKQKELFNQLTVDEIMTITPSDSSKICFDVQFDKMRTLAVSYIAIEKEYSVLEERMKKVNKEMADAQQSLEDLQDKYEKLEEAQANERKKAKQKKH